MQFMMRLAPITFPIAMITGLGLCIDLLASPSKETSWPPNCSFTMGSWDYGATLDIASFRR